MSTAELTTTSYAILGLLAIKPWSTYELAQQMERSLKHFWPRAQSRIYEEPKRLAALGLAKASTELVGRRPRTIYTITAKGRRSLQAWLAKPGAGPVIEFEAILKSFLAEHARKDDVKRNIEAIREWAERQNVENIGFARLYCSDGAGPFEHRLASITLAGRFISDFTDMVASWADWAAAQVDEWPDNMANADPDWDFLYAMAERPLSSPS